jgi:hypothetical protein
MSVKKPPKETSMASIERTAYPRFRHNLTTDEIVEWYQPTTEEITFVRQYARKEEQHVTLLLLLKSIQRLGYFPNVADIPAHHHRETGCRHRRYH